MKSTSIRTRFGPIVAVNNVRAFTRHRINNYVLPFRNVYSLAKHRVDRVILVINVKRKISNVLLVKRYHVRTGRTRHVPVAISVFQDYDPSADLQVMRATVTSTVLHYQRISI